MDSSSSGNGETRAPHLWLYGVLALYAVVFLVYAETWAFALDEGYHLVAAQLIGAGRTPYIDFCFPQTPLNAYWNAAWMRLLGLNWRVPHLLASLFTIGAVLLTADYVMRRFPVRGWRVAGAIAAALGIGLNGVVFEYGAIQAYGICLFGMVAGFRLAVRAVDADGWLPSAAAGLCAGIAAASSLLSAAAAPVLLCWMVFYSRAGSRWKKFAAFALGILVPFAPVFWLFARAPKQTWFNVFRYHAFFRKLYWPDTTRYSGCLPGDPGRRGSTCFDITHSFESCTRSIPPGILAVCPGTPADVVQRVSISHILSKAVLDRYHPVFWLFARGPRQTWFNVFRYHTFFRKLY